MQAKKDPEAAVEAGGKKCGNMFEVFAFPT